MNRSPFIKSIVAAGLLSSNVYAGDGGLAGDGPQAAPQKQVLTIDAPDGKPLCVVNLTKRQPGDILAKVAIQKTETPKLDSILDAMTNETRTITTTQYSPVASKNRDEQMSAAKQMAVKLAEQLISPEILLGDKEDVLINTQMLLSTSLGKLPDGILTNIETILQADLSALDNPNKRPEYKVKTDNALAEMTKVITQFRKEGMDVNTISNGLSSWSKIPIIGRAFENAGDVLRRNFQTVIHAIEAILETLDQSVAHMYMRHEQMKQARLELRTLQRYLDVSYTVADELERIAQEYRDSQSMDENAVAQYNRTIMSPLAERKGMILRERAAVVKAYRQFHTLMDSNLDLIVQVSNLRETAKLELYVNGAGQIIANEQQATLNMARDAMTALDELGAKSVEDIKRQGIQRRQFASQRVASKQALMNSIDQLLNETEVTRQSDEDTRVRLQASNAEFLKRVEAAEKKGGLVDLIAISDEINNDKQFSRRTNADLNKPLPELPQKP